MIVRELMREMTETLRAAGVEDARFDARQLLKGALGLDTVHYLLWEQRELSALFPEEELRRKLRRLRRDCERRAAREPLQQILGETIFYGLRFLVNEDVLCPRQDTELLVERVIKDYENVDKSALRVLDLCTGSGCIALSLASCGGFPDVSATDISEAALALAEKNRAALLGEEKGSLRLLRSDLFEALSGECFDIIVSNPPYIPTAVIDTLSPEVRDHEPRIALDGHADGLYFYRRITEEAGRFLRAGGRLYVEIGYDQGECVQELFLRAGFTEVRLCQDLGGNDRLVCGRRSGYNMIPVYKV